MTLLELLRRELPKRGGWPEGATCAVQDSDKLVMFANCDPKEVYCRATGDWYMNASRLNGNGDEGYELADDRATAIVTREQYEATCCDGTDLPPLGVECEYLDSNTGKWYPVTMKYVSDQIVVICGMTNIFGEEQGKEIAKDIQLDKPQFRPLRTEAERAIDEMVQLSGVSTGAAKILYDAGYRK